MIQFYNLYKIHLTILDLNQKYYKYEYKTPFGILKNNLRLEDLSKIFKESLTVYNKEYYESELFNYLKTKQKTHELKFTEINFLKGPYPAISGQLTTIS